MNLSNATGIPAQVTVAELPDQPNRIGVLAAKATFTFDRGGRVQLDTQQPLPLFADDTVTPSGTLPTDVRARRSNKFEVMLLGNAYPPRKGAAVTKVALTIGAERREILVQGDRVWLGNDPKRASISQAKSFERMPLVYERSFGGTTAVQIDAQSFVDVPHPINPRGKGYDAGPVAEGLGKLLRAPKGYPALPREPRVLPNLENPRAPIARWEDAPDPVGWAPTPPGSAISFMRIIQAQSAAVAKMQQQGTYSPERFQQELQAKGRQEDDPDTWIYRAHPDWIIALPPPAATVRMENLIADQPSVDFRLPQLRLVADYVIKARQGQLDLRPQSLVLLPEERRFYLVYRLAFNFEPSAGHERSFRLRSEAGWPQA